jgi:poly(3-hydroxybutyrate) depolymerase
MASAAGTPVIPCSAEGPPAIPFGLLDGWLEGYAAAFNGAADWFAHAVSGKPLDVTQWFTTATDRRRPTWATPHEIVLETPLARLRDFSTSRRRTLIPTLVLPPQAGHDSCIVDFSPEQSQMRTIVESGLERALALDWVGATEETKDASIDDYLEVVDEAVDSCGGRVNLIGDCQGGWLAAIYAALYPDRINTLTLAGAPIDFHAGEPVIHELLRVLAPAGYLRFYEALVASGGGVLKGEHMLAGFVAIQPGDEVSRQFELLLNLDDSEHTTRYAKFENWFKHTQDIPGAFYLWIVRHLFRDNELIGGSLCAQGRQVKLSEIGVPLNLLGGSADHITPPDQVFALADFASTPERLILRDVTPGGHLGLFMSHQALREHWPALLAHTLSHSEPKGPRAGRS